MPKISVLMTLYNSAGTVRSAVDSILQQTFTDFEFIVVDDGSLDNGLEIVQSYADPRIKTFRQENKGLPQALNVCANMLPASTWRVKIRMIIPYLSVSANKLNI